jgi:hypothetical protein
MNDKVLVKSKLRELREFLKATEMSYPHRRTLLAVLGAAIAINAGARVGDRFGEFNEFKLHLDDALGPFGLQIDEAHRPCGRPSSQTGHTRMEP